MSAIYDLNQREEFQKMMDDGKCSENMCAKSKNRIRNSTFFGTFLAHKPWENSAASKQ